MRERPGEYSALTGLRGFAALWVLLYHVWAVAGGPPLRILDSDLWRASRFLAMGWAGVDIFFCLSAFLLVIPYARWRVGTAPRPDTAGYLWRRVLRIYPAYLAQLGVLLVLAGAFGIGRMLNGGEIVAHLLLWFNMGREWIAPLVGVWFTLPIEFTFYLLLPFLAPLLDRGRWPWLLLGAIVLTIAYRALMFTVVSDQPVPIRVIALERLPGRLDQFVLGMLAGSALVTAGVRGWHARRPGFWFVGGVAGLVLVASLFAVVKTYWEGHPLLYVWHGLFAICLVPVLLGGAWEARPAMRLLANAPMRWLGRVSFGVYLWHMPILFALASRLPEAMPAATRFWVLLGLATPATLLVAQISHVLVERPLLKRRRRDVETSGMPASR